MTSVDGSRSLAARSTIAFLLAAWPLSVGVFDLARTTPTVGDPGPRNPNRWYLDGSRTQQLEKLLRVADAVARPGAPIEVRGTDEAHGAPMYLALWGALLLPERDIRPPVQGSDLAPYVVCFFCSRSGEELRLLLSTPEGTFYEREDAPIP